MAPLDATIQYLHWALIAAHEGANLDCRKVTITLDLKNRTATTSFTKTDAPENEGDSAILTSAMEAVCVALTGPEKQLDKEKCASLLRSRMKEFWGHKK